MTYLISLETWQKKALSKSCVPALPTGHATHCFPGVAAGQGTGFNEILPEQALAWLRTVQQDVGAKIGSVAKQEYGNVFVPWWTKQRDAQGVQMTQKSSLLGGALVLGEQALGYSPRCANSWQQELMGLCSVSAAHEVPLAILGLPPIGEARREEQLF